MSVGEPEGDRAEGRNARWVVNWFEGFVDDSGQALSDTTPELWNITIDRDGDVLVFVAGEDVMAYETATNEIRPASPAEAEALVSSSDVLLPWTEVVDDSGWSARVVDGQVRVEGPSSEGYSFAVPVGQRADLVSVVDVDAGGRVLLARFPLEPAAAPWDYLYVDPGDPGGSAWFRSGPGAAVLWPRPAAGDLEFEEGVEVPAPCATWGNSVPSVLPATASARQVDSHVGLVGSVRTCDYRGFGLGDFPAWDDDAAWRGIAAALAVEPTLDADGAVEWVGDTLTVTLHTDGSVLVEPTRSGE